MLSEVGYEPDQRELYVRFQKGALYRYDGVPRYVFDALLEAESHGRYFLRTIRERFPFSRL
jgi:hypothetical protein